MKKIFLLFFICAVCLLTGCKKKENNNRNIPELPVHLSMEKIDKVKSEEALSSITSGLLYIPLETTEQALIRNIQMAVFLRDGNLLVSDKSQILLYDVNGKFIRTISQKGNGPADFTRLNGLVADPRRGGFFMHTNNKVVEFDAEGNYVNNFPTTDRPMGIVMDKEKNLVLHRMNIPKMPEDKEPTWFLFRYDRQGNELKRYEDRSARLMEENILPLTTPIRPFYVFDENVYINEFGNDTIFRVDPDSLTPYAVIDLGELRMSASPEGTRNSAEMVFNEIKKKLYTAYLLEDDHFFYFTFGWGFSGEYLYATYNKKESRLSAYGGGGFNDPDGGLINDIDGGLPFFPTMITPEGKRLQFKTAEKFREYILAQDYAKNKQLYGTKFEKLYELAESLDDDDNPVLIIAKGN